MSVRARGTEGPESLQTDRRTQAGSEGAEGGIQGADRSRSPLPGSHLGLLRNQSLNTLTASASVDPVPWASHLPVAPGLSPAITE